MIKTIIGIIALNVSLTVDGKFEKKNMFCSGITFTFTKEGTNITGVSYRGQDYYTDFKSMNYLEDAINKACKK